MKTLIIYFSHRGSTKFVVDEVAKILGADIERIEPVEPLKKSGVFLYVKGGYEAMRKKSPEIETTKYNPNDYELIILAAPVWANTYPAYFRTYFRDNEIKNKKIALIGTYDGKIAKMFVDFKTNLKDNDFVNEIEFKGILKSKDRAAFSEQAQNWAKELL